jgi:hypothetical protein
MNGKKVIKNYELFGGIPRHIFFNLDDSYKNSLDIALLNYGEKCAEICFSADTKLGSYNDETITYKLLRMNSSETSKFKKFSLEPVSKYVTNELFYGQKLRGVKYLFNYFLLPDEEKSAEFQGLIGGQFEIKAPQIICDMKSQQLELLQRKVKYNKRYFDANNIRKDVKNVKFSKRIKCLKVENMNMESLTFEPNILYDQDRSNLESIDCYMYDGSELYFMQITVSDKHPLKLNGLQSIRDAALKALNISYIKCNVVFVVPDVGKNSKNLKNIQPLHNNQSKNIENFPVKGSFEYELMLNQWKLVLSFQDLPVYYGQNI